MWDFAITRHLSSINNSSQKPLSQLNPNMNMILLTMLNWIYILIFNLLLLIKRGTPSLFVLFFGKVSLKRCRFYFWGFRGGPYYVIQENNNFVLFTSKYILFWAMLCLPKLFLKIGQKCEFYVPPLSQIPFVKYKRCKNAITKCLIPIF